ncbi:hypothetical protein GCM10010377_43720 [Streptomyces viridiviolaceus]|nr:hypothetical protein GCM10010377_43720 [Streptomyces viridiviolaceus]
MTRTVRGRLGAGVAPSVPERAGTSSVVRTLPPDSNRVLWNDRHAKEQRTRPSSAAAAQLPVFRRDLCVRPDAAAQSGNA